MKDNTKDFIKFINSLDTNQFDLFLQLYNDFYKDTKTDGKTYISILNATISQICTDRIATEKTIKKKYTNIGGMPLQMFRWWWIDEL